MKTPRLTLIFATIIVLVNSAISVVEFSGSGFDSGSGSGIRDVTIVNGRINSVKVVLDATLSDWTNQVEYNFKTAIASAVNRHCTNNVCRKQLSRSLTADDVVILDGYPRVEGNGLAVAFYVHSNGAVVNANILANAVRSSTREIETAVGFSVLSVEVLEPNDDDEETNRKGLSLIVKYIIIVSAGALLLIIAVIAIIIFIILWKKSRKNRVKPVHVKAKVISQ